MDKEEALAREWCKQNGYVMMPEAVYEQDITKAYFEGQNTEPCEDAISRQAAIDAAIDGADDWDGGYNPTREEYIKKAINALPSVTPKPKMGRWIPVSERLPEEREWYLAVFKEKDTNFHLIPRVADYIGHGENKWQWVDGEGLPQEYMDLLECIAWMPLPEPYKAESEGEQ